MRLVRFFRSPLGWGRCVMMLVLMGAAWQAEAVNLNTATTQQLQQIKGIGPKTAERIRACIYRLRRLRRMKKIPKIRRISA